MKKTAAILFALMSVVLSGCESMGFQPHAIDEALTPTVDADTTVRTWNNGKPVEAKTENSQAFK